MKNKKGLTLIELIVSVILTSIVVVFLFQLLIELRYQSSINTGRIEYKVVETIVTKKIQNVFIDEKIYSINTCDSTNTCLEITFLSGNYLDIEITDNKKVLSVIKKDSNSNVLYQDIRQIPEKDETGYIGNFDSINYTTSAFEATNPSYDYRYDSLLKLQINMSDSGDNVYPITVYFPYSGGGDFSNSSYTLTVLLDGGTWSGTSPQEIVSGDTVTINRPVKVGYLFTGWTPSGRRSEVDGNTFKMGLEDSTITANWLSYSDMFTYTVGGNPGVAGTDFIITDYGDSTNWKIKFLTTGVFKPVINITIDAFMVGGGGGGARGTAFYGAGGAGGGYTATYTDISIASQTDVNVVIGTGGTGASTDGTAGNAGSMTYFLDSSSYAAAGGGGGKYSVGGNGGSGGGGGSSSNEVNGYPGKSDGESITGTSGLGQGSTTREFGELTGTLYAGGGGGAGFHLYTGGIGGAGGGGAGVGAGVINGTANTGGGGGGNRDANGGTGGTGVVVIRNS